MEHHKLDITKDKCPITFVKVKVKLAKLKKGDLLEVLLNSCEPLKNVPRSAQEQGHKVHHIEPDGEFYTVLIEKGD
jgi:tRNA 2-thiouridine synthesizing protein A